MNKFFALVLILCASVLAFAGGDESAPIQEKEVQYKNWTFKNLRDGKDVNLRSFASGKKLVLVVYYAAWCPNWQRELPLVAKLYQKYKDQGFDVTAVSEYDSLENTKKDAEKNKLGFTIVTESESSQARDKTSHYQYRKAAGDTRNWGSPWNIFLEPSKFEQNGEVLTRKASVVNGEIIESEVEAFIRQKLGLSSEVKSAELSSAKKVEVCDPAVKFKKP